jgi:hypothetical protein
MTGKVTLSDPSLDACHLTERVERLRTAYFRACPEVCIERPQLVTRFHQELGLFNQKRISILDKARVYRRVLETREPIIWYTEAKDKNGQRFTFQGDSLFAGSTTTRFKGVVLYPAFLGLALWPELRSLPSRAANPYMISPEQARILNEEAFPPWLDRSILECARAEATESDSPPDFTLYQQLVFFLASKPNTISHTVPDFSRALKEGLRAVIDDAHARGQRAMEAAKPEFYAAIGEVLEGIISYSRRLAEEAETLVRR